MRVVEKENNRKGNWKKNTFEECKKEIKLNIMCKLK